MDRLVIQVGAFHQWSSPDQGGIVAYDMIAARFVDGPVGLARASTYSPLAPHPYMQKTRTLDCCIVLQGELVLVLDTQEVRMKAGEIAILRATNHAWSNRSNDLAVLSIASHDAAP